MSSFNIRPRFRQVLEISPQELQDRIVSFVENENCRCDVKSFPGFLCLRIPEEDQHFWSPRLHLHMEETEEGKTLIRGIYGPNANVWSLFLYGYIIIGFLGFITGVFAFSQLMIGYHPWGFWIFGTVIACAIALYLIAQTGQKLGAQQTFLLHRIYEDSIGQPIAVH